MIEILGTLVSLDLFKVMFCCDLEKCHGACCVEGDAGAPVEMDEIGLLEEASELVWNELTPKHNNRYGKKVSSILTLTVNWSHRL